MAEYLIDLFFGNAESKKCTVIRISQQDLLNDIHHNPLKKCALKLESRNTIIDLTKPESPKFDLSNLKNLSKLFFKEKNNFFFNFNYN